MCIHSVRRLVQRSVFGGVGALLCLYSPSSPADASEKEVRRQIVWFGDLNLSDPQGIAVLYLKIKAAAHRVCSERNARTHLIWSKADAECKRAAIAKAVAVVNGQRMALLQRESGGPGRAGAARQFCRFSRGDWSYT